MGLFQAYDLILFVMVSQPATPVEVGPPIITPGGTYSIAVSYLVATS